MDTMNKVLDLLARPVDWLLEPLNEPLLRFMEATGLIRPVEAIVRWLAKRLPPA